MPVTKSAVFGTTRGADGDGADHDGDAPPAEGPSSEPIPESTPERDPDEDWEPGEDDDPSRTTQARRLAAASASSLSLSVSAGTELARATGRRKAAVARVRLISGKGIWVINGRTLPTYSDTEGLRRGTVGPLNVLNAAAFYDVIVNVKGGGISGQAGAIRLGLARALADLDLVSIRPVMKREGYLTRDPRAVERKKAGLKKARKASQFSKR